MSLIYSLVSDATTLLITTIIIITIIIMNIIITSVSDMLREILALDIFEEYLLENVLRMIKSFEHLNGPLANSCFTKLYDLSVNTSGRVLFGTV